MSGDACWARRYSRYPSAGSTTWWSLPSTVHVRSPEGRVSHCARYEATTTVAVVIPRTVGTADNHSAMDTPTT